LPLWLLGQGSRVEGLRRGLGVAMGPARVDSMVEMSRQFMELSERDSAEKYAGLAYEEAKGCGSAYGQAVAYGVSVEEGYFRGMADALTAQAAIRTYFYGDFRGGEQLDREALMVYAKTANKKGLATTYSQLSFVCFAQSKYDEALQYSNESFALCYKDGDTTGVLSTLDLNTQVYLKRGEFDKGFNTAQSALQLSSRTGDSVEIKSVLLGLGTLCMGIEDYPLALGYYRAMFQHFTKADSMDLLKSEDLVWAKMEYAEIYSHLHLFDSALYRYSLFDTCKLPEKDLRIFLVSKGEYFLLSRQYDKALPLLLRGLAIHSRLNDRNEIVRAVLDIAETYNSLHNEHEALRFARQGLALGLETRAPQRMRDAYKLLYCIYDRQGETDSAYVYFRRYILTKESLTDDQTKGRFAANAYLDRIDLLKSEKLIKEQQLKRESFIRNVLIAFVLLVVLLCFLVLRNILLARRNEKLMNENTRKELQHKSSEMEMQALRAQMNPHFIFNCLNSINRFIVKNEPEAASDYLTQFSRLIRLVLNNSKKAWILLEDEIDMLRLYLDMEKLRFKDAFSYSFVCGNGVEPAGLFIPPLLIQPFVENAIWHGLMHKKGNGSVILSFLVEGEMLQCAIIDDGVGRPMPVSSGSGPAPHQSMGIRMTQDRLALINHELNDEKVTFSIEDLVDGEGMSAGTRVNLSFRFRRTYDENGTLTS